MGQQWMGEQMLEAVKGMPSGNIADRETGKEGFLFVNDIQSKPINGGRLDRCCS